MLKQRVRSSVAALRYRTDEDYLRLVNACDASEWLMFATRLIRHIIAS